VLLP
jgi:hypothetical protein